MPEPITDVNQEGLPSVPPSPAERQRQEQEAKEVVNEQADPTSQPEVTQEVAQPDTTQPVQAVNPDVDEFGVPWKNRAMEYKRKNEELFERLPTIVEEKIKSVSQPQQKQYTYEELEAYKLAHSSDLNVVTWATAEQRKIQAEDQRKTFEEVVVNRERAREADTQRQKSFEYVKNTYPEALNQNHPMAQGIRHYMSIPEIANNPQGLVFAAKAAYADYMQSQAPVLQGKIQQQKAEIRQAQKASMTEGSGRKVVNTAPPQQAGLERLRTTGSSKDAESIVGAILRSKGMIQD